MKIWRCNICGNLMMVLDDSGVMPVCCGEQMEELEPGTSDGAVEKHVPVVEHGDGIATVMIGEVEHPMTKEHYIEWVILETEKGYALRHLEPGAAPQAAFCLTAGDKVKAAYAYCNLHGLWQNG